MYWFVYTKQVNGGKTFRQQYTGNINEKYNCLRNKYIASFSFLTTYQYINSTYYNEETSNSIISTDTACLGI